MEDDNKPDDEQAKQDALWEKYKMMKYIDIRTMGIFYPFDPPKVPKPSKALSAMEDKSGNEHSCEFGSLKYFGYCGVGGFLACGVTHLLVTPLDLVKCRIQVDPAKYQGIVKGFKMTVHESGFQALSLGWAPTVIGYSMQGCARFGLYEVCKIFFADLIGPEYAYKQRTALYLSAAATAEFFADFLLCPWEAAKVRMQTQQGFAGTLREALPKIYNSEGINGFYKGLPPLWLRQIPYTMMKFASFERTLEFLYKSVVPKPRSECTKGQQLVVTFIAGYIAGVFCAIVSHPGDTIVSKLNKEKEATLGGILKKIKFMELWTGLGPRILMVGSLAGGQWLIYDAVKVWLNIPRPPPPEMPASMRK